MFILFLVSTSSESQKKFIFSASAVVILSPFSLYLSGNKLLTSTETKSSALRSRAITRAGGDSIQDYDWAWDDQGNYYSAYVSDDDATICAYVETAEYDLSISPYGALTVNCEQSFTNMGNFSGDHGTPSFYYALTELANEDSDSWTFTGERNGPTGATINETLILDKNVVSTVGDDPTPSGE